jgi:hypothetical protein
MKIKLTACDRNETPFLLPIAILFTFCVVVRKNFVFYEVLCSVLLDIVQLQHTANAAKRGKFIKPHIETDSPLKLRGLASS